jgi:hypothetical protein
VYRRIVLTFGPFFASHILFLNERMVVWANVRAASSAVVSQALLKEPPGLKSEAWATRRERIEADMLVTHSDVLACGGQIA